MQTSKQTAKKVAEMKIQELLDFLGYEAQKKNILLEDIYNFLNAYLARENLIHFKSERVIECAVEFLEESSRGERYWPTATFSGHLVWSTDHDCILEAVGHIIRRRLNSLSVCRNQREARRKRRAAMVDNGKTRSRKRKPSQETRVGPPCKEIFEPTKMKEWNEPPEEPATQTCINYIRELDPENDTEISGFTKKWLLNDMAAWPQSSLSRIERFMHDTDFYISAVSQGNEESPKNIEFASALREENEISDMTNAEIAIYLRRFQQQIKVLSQRLIYAPTFVLEYHRRGTIQKTAKFDRFWKRKGEYWGLDSDAETNEDTCPTKKHISDSDVARSRFLDSGLQRDPVFTTAGTFEPENSLLEGNLHRDGTKDPDTSLPTHIQSESGQPAGSPRSDSIMFDAPLTQASSAASTGSVSSSWSVTWREEPNGERLHKSLLVKLAPRLPPTYPSSLRNPVNRPPMVKTESSHLEKPVTPFALIGSSWDTPIELLTDDSSQICSKTPSPRASDSTDGLTGISDEGSEKQDWGMPRAARTSPVPELAHSTSYPGLLGGSSGLCASPKSLSGTETLNLWYKGLAAYTTADQTSHQASVDIDMMTSEPTSNNDKTNKEFDSSWDDTTTKPILFSKNEVPEEDRDFPAGSNTRAKAIVQPGIERKSIYRARLQELSIKLSSGVTTEASYGTKAQRNTSLPLPDSIPYPPSVGMAGAASLPSTPSVETQNTQQQISGFSPISPHHLQCLRLSQTPQAAQDPKAASMPANPDPNKIPMSPTSPQQKDGSEFPHSSSQRSSVDAVCQQASPLPRVAESTALPSPLEDTLTPKSSEKQTSMLSPTLKSIAVPHDAKQDTPAESAFPPQTPESTSRRGIEVEEVFGISPAQGTSSDSVAPEAISFKRRTGAYAMIPAIAPYTKAPSSLDEALMPVTSMNSDQRLYKPVNRCNPDLKTLELFIELEDESIEPKPRSQVKVILIFQTINGALDFQNPVPSSVLRESTLRQFFDLYSARSGIDTEDFSTLTFTMVSAHNEILMTKSWSSAEEWRVLKMRVKNLLDVTKSAKPKMNEFEIWVTPEETALIQPNDDDDGLDGL